MTNSTNRVQRPDTGDGSDQPNHLIIWLDKFIGKFNEYLLLKRAFFMTTDPTTGYPVSLKEEDITHSIRCNEPIIVRLNGIQFMIRAFDTVDNCFEAIENNFDKRLFIITSGSKGKILVPALMKNYPEHIRRNYPMYIFCGNMNMVKVGDVEPTNDWAQDFEDDLLMFNHEDLLLERIVLDSANYFSTKGGELYQEHKLESAQTHYGWALRMLERYDNMIGKPIMASKRRELDSLINNIEHGLAQRNNGEEGRGSESS